MTKILSILILLLCPLIALGQGQQNIVDVTDPPVAAISGSTYDVTNGVVTRASGTFVFPAWIADCRLQIAGTIYSVNTRDSDTQVTLNDTGLTGVSGASISFGPDKSTPWDNVDDSPFIQACVNFIEGSFNTRGILFFPGGAGDFYTAPVETNDGYRINTTITLGNSMRGWRIQGTGLGNNNGGQGAARLSWCGAGTGPVFALQDCSGLVMDGISFMGNGVAGSGDPIEKLVTIRNEDDVAGNATFNLAILNCQFRDAPTLVELGCLNEPEGIGGNANYLWSNCLFEGEHDGSDKNQFAVRNLHSQGLMHTFQQCEWRNCNICIQFDTGGRFQVYGGGLGSCWQFINRLTGSVNSAGVSVRDLFVNNGGVPRTVLYESANPGIGRYWGPITFEGIQLGANWPAVNLANITSYTGNTLTLSATNQIDVRPGDEIAFYDVSDPDTRLATTVVSSRSSNQVYTLASTAAQLGLTVNANLRAAHGTPLFKLTGAERLSVRDCWWNRDSIRGKRLCRLETGNWSTIVQPFASFTMNSGLRATTASQLASIYLDIDNSSGGTAYYRFTDCDDLVTTTAPLSFTNLPDQGGGGGGLELPIDDANPIVHDTTDSSRLIRLDAGNIGTGATRVLSMPNADVQLRKNNLVAVGVPTANEDSGDGYDVGSLWVDTVGDAAYICVDSSVGSAVWASMSGGGSSLPVSDTTSIVRDPVDSTKQIRLDAGNIGVDTVRTLTMPNSDVVLHQNVTSALSPTVGDDSGDGYTIGSIWIDTTADKVYLATDVTLGAAVWKDLTQMAGGGGGELPVDDTTSLVRDPIDTTRQVRLDAGSVSASTVRVLEMPDSDVQLRKNNLTAGGIPTINDDSGDGYGTGSIWIDTAGDAVYVLVDDTLGAAVWKDLTLVGEGGPGLTLPVDDTTSLVRDPTDTSKQVRINAGSVATSTTRSLIMPDSDVTLYKNNVAAGSPVVTNDSSQGYSVGSIWINTSNQNAYLCTDNSVGSAVWKSLTEAGGGGGADLPVDDTTSIVRDPLDNSKQIRIDVGLVGTSSTRVLSIPNSDVSLHKNNLAASDPTVNHDSADGYSIGSRWINSSTLHEWVCLDSTAGAAVWKNTTRIPPFNNSLPWWLLLFGLRRRRESSYNLAA